MFGWFRKRPQLPEASATASERLAQLETDLRALRRDVDDLDDSFRSWRGRESKREARAARDGEEPAAPQLQLVPKNGAAPSVRQLRASGRWPFGR